MSKNTSEVVATAPAAAKSETWNAGEQTESQAKANIDVAKAERLRRAETLARQFGVHVSDIAEADRLNDTTIRNADRESAKRAMSSPHFMRQAGALQGAVKAVNAGGTMAVLAKRHAAAVKSANNFAQKNGFGERITEGASMDEIAAFRAKVSAVGTLDVVLEQSGAIVRGDGDSGKTA